MGENKMKRFISIVCCIMFISVASMSFATEEEQSSTDRTTVLVEIIQLQSQLQLLNNLITNLAASTKNVEEKIAVLKENLKQLETKNIKEDKTKIETKDEAK